MKKVLAMAVFAAVFGTGCSSIDGCVNDGEEAGKKAADTGLKTGLLLVCPGAGAGAISREFDTHEKFVEWAKLCGFDNMLPLVQMPLRPVDPPP